MVCVALSYFSTTSHKRHDFLKTVAEHNIETFLIIRRISEIGQKSYVILYVKYPLFLSYFKANWIFSQIFKKYSKYQIWKKKNPSTRSWVVPCGRTDGRTDRHDEANSRFSQYCKRTQKGTITLQYTPYAIRAKSAVSVFLPKKCHVSTFCPSETCKLKQRNPL